MKHLFWIASLGAALLCGCAKEQTAGPLAGPQPGHGAVHASVTDTTTSRRLAPLSIPLHFEANVGQADARALFVSRGQGYGVFLTRTGAVFNLAAGAGAPLACHAQRSCARPQTRGDVVQMSFVGANPQPATQAQGQQPGRSNYFVGNDRARWHRNLTQFDKVRYRKVYPGIDVVFYGRAQALEYDFIVAPGSDPKQIVLGMDGVRSMHLDPGGDLVLATDHGELRQHKPVVYQQLGNRRVAVEGRYALRSDRRVGFELGRYDARAPLVIDPMFGFSTYLSGIGSDQASAVATDADGNTYVAGWVSLELPYDGDVWKTLTNAFVAKYDTGGHLVYTTYLGGTRTSGESNGDSGTSVAVDTDGHAYVAGLACSQDFPVVNPVQAALGGQCDAFLAKLASDGSALDYSTYVGGSENDAFRETDLASFVAPYSVHVAVDGEGNAYLTGRTESTDFPVHNALQPTLGSFMAFDSDGYVVKLNPAGDAFVYSTYLGGNDLDRPGGIAVDASGNAYIVGTTSSGDFPMANAWRPSMAGANDAFVTEINADGSALVYSSYLGGASGDTGLAIAVDGGGNAYVSGITVSNDFPFSAAPGGCPDAGAPANTLRGYVAKITAGGIGAAYSACLKGANPAGVAVDGEGNAYVTGWTEAADFPTVAPMQAHLAPGDATPRDAFVSKLSPDGTTLLFSTFLGGSHREAGTGIAVDSQGRIHVVGNTASGDFPTLNGSGATESPSAPGSIDNGFVATIADGEALSVADVAVVEGNDSHVVDFTVHMSSPSQGVVEFDVDTTADTAVEGVDYQGLHEHVVLQPGETEKTLSVTVLGDAVPEPDETFGVSLSNIEGAVAQAGTAVGTLGNDDTIISVEDGAAPEGNPMDTGNNPAVATIRLSSPVWAAVSFDVNFVDGTATVAGNDFYEDSERLTIPAGSTSIEVPVFPVIDEIVEPDETFAVTISNVDGATMGNASGTFTILNDDTVLTVHGASIVEGNSGTTVANVTVSLSVPSASPVTFMAMANSGSATAGSDYDAINFLPMSIPAGSTSTTIPVVIHGDTTSEPSEVVQVWVQSIVGARTTATQADLTILNDDARLSIGDASIIEGNSGTRTANFTVKLSNPSATPVTFTAATASKTATSGTDFVGRSATALVIPANATSARFTVTVKGDVTIEPSETFLVNISGVSGATVSDRQAVGTIRNDDASLTIADASTVEGDWGTKTLWFTVKLSNASASPVTFNLTTRSKTAGGSDFVAQSLLKQAIAAGKTSRSFPVTIKGDRLHEANETFTVNITSVVGATVKDGQAIGTIINND